MDVGVKIAKTDLNPLIFMEWIKIFASVGEANLRLVENIPQLLILHGKRISLVLRKGEYFAFSDACPHNGESLHKGKVNFMGEIVCPLHEYRFRIQTGKEAEERCRDLKTYFVRIDDTGFYIGL